MRFLFGLSAIPAAYLDSLITTVSALANTGKEDVFLQRPLASETFMYCSGPSLILKAIAAKRLDHFAEVSATRFKISSITARNIFRQTFKLLVGAESSVHHPHQSCCIHRHHQRNHRLLPEKNSLVKGSAFPSKVQCHISGFFIFRASSHENPKSAAFWINQS